jgi:16S rRNA (cytosine1402-N4)-methyltransferase
MNHFPVLLKEVIQNLIVNKSGVYGDFTLGAGGHTLEILKTLEGDGKVYGFDLDINALEIAKNVLKDYDNVIYINDNFVNCLKYINCELDGILMDVGMSSMQIDDSKRGFSYMKNNSLDMRMNQNTGITAKEILNTYSVDELSTIFGKYGEIDHPYPLSKAIIYNRPIIDSSQLVKITDKYIKGSGHSAKKVFQALRIEVNNELNNLELGLNNAFKLLKKGGILCVITFHSLEEKVVKKFINEVTLSTLPNKIPVKGILPTQATSINKKGILPTELELSVNSRSHSAKLRVIKKN